MCNGPIMSKLISFSLPLMAASILQLLFNAVDIVVVGRFTGREALAAVGSTSALINMFVNLFIGISLGANVMTARYIATKEVKKVSEVVHTAITVALLSGTLMIFVGLIFARLALTLMGTPVDVINQSVLYMRIYFVGMPFFMLYNYGAAILRAVGDTKRPLFYLVIAGVLNAGLNMFLVIVFHLGVAGVAIATVFSQMISCVLVIRCLCLSDGPYRIDFRKLAIHWEHLRNILQVGVPAGLQSIVISFSNVLLQSSVNSFGAIAMAGYTATNNVFGFMYVTINSFTQACMSFTSQNYGARKSQRMDQILKDCLLLECTIPLALGIGVYLLGPQILHIYTPDDTVVACGMEIMKISTIPYFLCGIMDMLPGALRGMGHSAVPMVLSVIGTVGTRIIWIFGVFPCHRSLFWLFISYPASWFATIVLQAFCFYFVRKKVHAELSAA